MPYYKKKPVIIEAKVFTGDNFSEMIEFIGIENFVSGDYITKNLGICTLEGIITASAGDYIIKGIIGEFYPCKPNIFNATYEEVEESRE